MSATGKSAVCVSPCKSQLLKWVGNKQRSAQTIISYFPDNYRVYHEPFLGSGAILAALAPQRALASDVFPPLLEIWSTLKNSPETLKRWYAVRHEWLALLGKKTAYERIRAAFNAAPNGADLLFLCRSCYGGVVRFRRSDGHMSTPCGVHNPISPQNFARRVDQWHARIAGAEFAQMDYRRSMARAERGDLIYCDPPYSHTQAILYGAQSFSLLELLAEIANCKGRGVRVALSIDGSKRSGGLLCDLPIPAGLFRREIFINRGRSMLKRFQMNGKTLEGEDVADRILLTY